MWNKKLVELLIEKYREHNNLYNSQNPNYLDRSKRTKSLVEIANDLKQYCEEINVEEIKKKIHTLRSQFIRELRENHRRNDFEIKLWCFDQLEFLRPFCALRSTMPYVSNKKSPQHDEDTLLDEFEEIAVETSNKWEQNNSTNSKRYSNATDMNLQDSGVTTKCATKRAYNDDDKIKSKIRYFEEKSKYFLSELNNMKIEKTMMILEAKKLRLEIEQLEANK